MEKRFNVRDKITVPNCITMLRLIGSLCMIFTKIFTLPFYVIYTFCGVTDVLDGFVARMTKKSTEFGARLDSVADLLFYGIMLIKLLPHIYDVMPNEVPAMVASLVVLRICSYTIAAFRYKKFASLHTYMNKASGFCCFLMPYLIKINIPEVIVYWIVYAVALVAGLEELIIHSTAQTYGRENRTAIKTVKSDRENK